MKTSGNFGSSCHPTCQVQNPDMASQNAEAAFGDRPELLETRLAVISADPNMLPENLPDKAETTDE